MQCYLSTSSRKKGPVYTRSVLEHHNLNRSVTMVKSAVFKSCFTSLPMLKEDVDKTMAWILKNIKQASLQSTGYSEW